MIHTIVNYDERVEQFVSFLVSDDIYIQTIPRCYYPLITLYGKKVTNIFNYFPQDVLLGSVVRDTDAAMENNMLREYVESVCTLRPELVDTLWKVDRIKPVNLKRTAFKICSYSAQWSPEIQEYLKLVADYKSDSSMVIFIPCAELKPFEDKNIFHHEIVKHFYPLYDVVVVSGALGVIPYELWKHAPNYDAGIPNFYRVEDVLRKFLSVNNHYTKIISAVDFYGKNVLRVLANYNDECELHFPLNVKWRDSYCDMTKYLPAIKSLV